ncbi:glutamate-cysteine ligase catalytic subunit [Kipferlia bialata]|uniref:Glutamate--cysteine ligase n=1 Tax=Kipferlia bialata TaxID=797122 RepID=A0A9K3GIH6_9EUKA|nr:glutamate-cysteine ligase catalytic subunit [Kipferlia bialata]|eukprot:g4861.t1
MCAPEVLAAIEAEQDRREEAGEELMPIHAVPEYGRHMIEATPLLPYKAGLCYLAHLPEDMRRRRELIQSYLPEGCKLLTVTSYPLMGVGHFTHPPMAPGGPHSQSVFLPDGMISPHPRFATLTRHIRKRRGTKVRINVPVFEDSHTPKDIVTPPQIVSELAHEAEQHPGVGVPVAKGSPLLTANQQKELGAVSASALRIGHSVSVSRTQSRAGSPSRRGVSSSEGVSPDAMVAGIYAADLLSPPASPSRGRFKGDEPIPQQDLGALELRDFTSARNNSYLPLATSPSRFRGLQGCVATEDTGKGRIDRLNDLIQESTDDTCMTDAYIRSVTSSTPSCARVDLLDCIGGAVPSPCAGPCSHTTACNCCDCPSQSGTGVPDTHHPSCLGHCDSTNPTENPCLCERASLPRCVYMDAMGFGMGLSGLQCTFQTPNMHLARYVYDQLQPVCPPCLALSAATPWARGMLTGWDARYGIISDSVDDRKAGERSVQTVRGDGDSALCDSALYIPQSRYGVADAYIAAHPAHCATLNDIFIPVSGQAMESLLKGTPEVDLRLAVHISHLFVRDPLVVFDNAVDIDDETRTDHFENIQSSNWQTVRFKPPPSDASTGWRVEFRVMDVLPTDVENAAYLAFISLLTRCIALFGLCFYTPLSLVHESIIHAHGHDACNTMCTPFRENLLLPHALPFNTECSEAVEGARQRYREVFASQMAASDERWARESETTYIHNPKQCLSSEYCPRVRPMTVQEIFCGSSTFPGLLPVVDLFLDICGSPLAALPGFSTFFGGVCNQESVGTIRAYLGILAGRAQGKLVTGAAYLRDYVLSHPDYKQDSVISQAISDGLMDEVQRLNTLGLQDLCQEYTRH